MTWYTTADAQRDAQKPSSVVGLSYATVQRLAREGGCWKLQELPSTWDTSRFVAFSPDQLFVFARLLAAEIRK